MRKLNIPTFAAVLAGCGALWAQVSGLEGTVKKVDSGSKTIVVESADGVDHTFHYAGNTVVDGAKGTDAAAIHSVEKVGEGSKVVAHYTTKGGKDTVHEIDRVGEDGMKSSTGTIEHIDRGSKTLVVKAADGTKTTYHLTDDAAVDSGKDIAEGTEKSAHVTVYYTEKGGQKVAHFFKSSL